MRNFRPVLFALLPAIACWMTGVHTSCTTVNGDNDNGSNEHSGNDNVTPPVDDDATGTVCFPLSSIWYQAISSASPDEQSEEIIGWLEENGGWGNGRFQIDFSMEVLYVDDDVPFRAFTPTEDHFLPDCDLDDVPVPQRGTLEGESGYECTQDGDCHLIVVHEPTHTLYEMWRANIVGGAFFGGCLAVWDLSRDSWPGGRGADCTSADAAGLPIAPLLFTAEEVASGSIDHAIRFILPNDRIRAREYVSPATHSTGATRGSNSAPPYGARFRLRPDFPLESLPNEASRVVARALQTSGMFLADAGNIALTGASDRYTTAKWSDLMETRDLDSIQVSDFEVLELGETSTFTGDCVR